MMVKTGPTSSSALLSGQGPAVIESVRDRILHTARDLFYRDGIRAVGVDTVVAQSGVAKTSLYRWFPSKDALIAAVLEEEAKYRWERWDKNAAISDQEPRALLRSQLAGIARFVAHHKYRGCPFMNVTAEFADPQHPARMVATEVCNELRRRVAGLIRAIPGVRDPEVLTDQLVLLIDGTLSAAHMQGSDGPQRQLISAADALIDAQLR
jgi:AcrR family transcriptional regulator